MIGIIIAMGGLKAIKRQAKYLKKHTKKREHIKWVPKEGCGDPEVVKIDKECSICIRRFTVVVARMG